MIERPTVLVLGAGASAHLNMPMGPGLLNMIQEGLTRQNSGLFKLLAESGFALPLLNSFGAELRESGRQSIDVFLEHRPEYREVGKLAIAATLIPYENPDVLFTNGWYHYLYERLGPRPEEFARSRLAVITFNYDRSLEWFLFRSLRNSYGLKEEDAKERMRNVPIVHVHGRLGGLPYEGGAITRPYGYQQNTLREDAQRVKDSIKIAAEGAELDPEFMRAREMLSHAQMIVFLGFGYLRENLYRLGFPQMPYQAAVWGTAYNVREGDRMRFISLMKNDNYRPELRVAYPVLEFLQEYGVLL